MKILCRAIAGIFAILVLGIIVFAYINWHPDRPVAELAVRWASPPSQFLDISGMQVLVRDEGVASDPMPIVLLHGASLNLNSWAGWVQRLKRSHRVITFDLPGFGLTGPSPDGDYTIEAYVRFLRLLLDRLGIQHCILGGNSLGGNIAWEGALAMPDRVEKLILVDAGGYPTPSSSPPIGFRIASIPALSPIVNNVLPRSVIAASLRNVYGDPSKVTAEMIEEIFAMTLREGNRKALVQFLAQYKHGTHAGLITGLRVPTLILWGARDRLFPPEDAQHFHRDIAGSQLVIFDGLGHMPQEEDPERTLAAVKVFLGELPP
jgi:pimeloyl-ACP methyl ester carboxylesterase